jgi:Zn-finger nucleic acid-binding protein
MLTLTLPARDRQRRCTWEALLGSAAIAKLIPRPFRMKGKEAAVPLSPAELPEKKICPREGHPLTHGAILGIEFFSCKTCHGLWFGPAALEVFALHAAQGGSVPESLAFRRHPAIQEGTARCLCSSHPLMKLRKKDGVSLDDCPVCGAVWLDGGELAAILPRSARNGSDLGERGASSIGESGAIWDVGEAILHVIAFW